MYHVKQKYINTWHTIVALNTQQISVQMDIISNCRSRWVKIVVVYTDNAANIAVNNLSMQDDFANALMM